jgi:uncharacterized lipoprotein YddW (UPF0748 family)
MLPLALAALAAPPAAGPPPIAREFRAAWVATVANIDWPSKPGLPADAQKKELTDTLDRCKALNLNAVVFQVRPMCDALYKSDLEPWSVVLTGEPGKDPGYDPLAFAVEQAHARGLELHAWFNPYRAWSPTAKAKPPANHLAATRPELVKTYGKHLWLNPTHPDVQKHSLAVLLDCAKRYDLDGVHMDDYFYPYPEQDADKKEIPFPDDDTWADYQKAGDKLARDDWRRKAVDDFVRAWADETHKLKPWVKVGVSPFGIWRPGHPPGIQGFDQYAKLYADARKWLNEGRVDYFTPQLYWPIAQEKQSYPKLLGWWAGENTKQRHLWPGNYTGKHPAAEIAEQVRVTRASGTATGNVHFSMKALAGEKATALRGLYAEPALVPASPWLGAEKPGTPSTDLGHLGRTVRAPGAVVVAVQTLNAGKWTTTILPTPGGVGLAGGDLLAATLGERVVLTPVSRTGVAGGPVEVPGGK